MPRKDSESTFICISKKNRDILLSLKVHHRETYDEVLERILQNPKNLKK